MKNLFIFILATINHFVMAQPPTMQVWTDAWHAGNAEIFKNVYSKDAIIFPPSKPSVQGNELILEFMKGGFGKVEVIFEAEKQIISENLAFEAGVFKDIAPSDQQITGEGKYAITWILEKSIWKVQCHTWSMPFQR